jgi:hypothetical protein
VRRAVTKPTKIALGIGVAAVACAALALGSTGIVRGLWVWTALACVIASLAYAFNRPTWLGKVGGATAPRAVLVLPYLVAFRVACRLMARWREPDRPTRVAPGVWLSGRIDTGTLPHGVTTVVDLVAEYGADRGIRSLPGYRSLPVLDGGFPPDVDAFVQLVREVAAMDGGDVLVHCDSGRGRAPTFAAALLVARGLAVDPGAAMAAMRAHRPVVAPTRSDLAFLARVLPHLRRLARRRIGAAPVAVDRARPVG